MAQQLWMSPTTGYRRRGTRLVELRSLLGAGITARVILEPLWCCPAEAPAALSAGALARRDFDTAGVKDAQGGPVTGFVEKAQLTGGRVGDHRQDIPRECVASDETSLADLLQHLHARPHVFVAVDASVCAIVTRADLNKPPARAYFQGLLSLLEMHLGFWVAVGYPGDSWQGSLKADRIEEATKLLQQRRARDPCASLVECLQICDKRVLVVQKETLRTAFGLASKTKAAHLLQRAEDIRNRLAHSQLDLARGSSWPEVVDLVWSIEKALEKSDENVERQATGTAQPVPENALWPSILPPARG